MNSHAENLKRVFNLASLRKRAKALIRPADAEKTREIINRYGRERHKQETAYHKSYEGRFKLALQARIDKAGAKDLTLKHRMFGSDNFDKTALTRAAHRDVQHDHTRRMAQLEQRETQELDTLVATAEQRDVVQQHLRENPRKDFQRATDRRSRPGRQR
jgi:hypothetical protein